MSDIFHTLSSTLSKSYVVESELGAGGMATVFVAEDLKHARKVAIKVLNPELAVAVGADRFLREISTTASLRHPHILPLYDSGEADGLLYYVMPLADGGSLRDIMNRDGQLPLDDALRIVSEVAEALEVAHAAGIVHRDVKPENVLIDGGHAVVSDFGVALALESASETRLTQTGLSLGTPEYMSPEQAFEGQDVDHRTDIYSLGCLLYEMLAGEPPYSGRTVQSLLIKQATDPVPSVRRLRPAVPASVDRTVTVALAKTAVDRFSSARAFLDSLLAADEATPPEKKSIVVLPFVNSSPDPDNEYFSDGLTEEIISDLSRLQALRVISRTSAMQLKGTDKDLKSIGRELGVRYVLEGSVRKAGDSLRITAQLVDAEDDVPLWGDKFAGTMDDVFGMQERVSREIADALVLTLTPEEEREMERRPVADVRELEFYLRGRHDLARVEDESLARAIRHFEEGLEVVGDSALLLAGLGQALVLYSFVTGGRDASPDLMDRAEAAARRALELDPDSAKANLVIAWIYNDTFRLREALPYADRALSLEPNDPETLLITSILFAWGGRTEEARWCTQRLREVDPLNVEPWVPLANIWTGQYEEAVAAGRRSLQHDPNNLAPRVTLAWALVYGQRSDEALEVLDEIRSGDEPFARLGIVLRHALRDEKQQALENVTESLAEWARSDLQFSWLLGGCLAYLGEVEDAVSSLEHCVNGGLSNHALLAEDQALLSSLQGEPSFEALLARIKDQ